MADVDDLIRSTLLPAVIMVLAAGLGPGCVPRQRAHAGAGGGPITVSATASPGVSVGAVDFHGWKAMRLANDTVEVVVVPLTGRIVRYGRLGGPNLLWRDDALDGKAPIPGTWSNYGGEKAWIWPQADWPARLGRTWPPPFDPGAFTVRTGPGLIRLTSAGEPAYGLHLERTISLAPGGSSLRIDEALRADTGPTAPAAPTGVSAVWSVASIPASPRIFARVDAGVPLAGATHLIFTDPWRIIPDERDRVLTVLRPAQAQQAKIGLQCDRLAVVEGPDLLIMDASATPSGSWRPGDQAQCYSQPDAAADPAHGRRPYLELEFTAPLADAARGPLPVLHLQWRIVPCRGLAEADIRQQVASAP